MGNINRRLQTAYDHPDLWPSKPVPICAVDDDTLTQLLGHYTNLAEVTRLRTALHRAADPYEQVDRLAKAQRAAVEAWGRVHPTPTYAEVAAEQGYDPAVDGLLR